jgi:6,7-dimethyl-8-ribityllumazine synthase
MRLEYEKRTPISFQFDQKPHILIVQSSYYQEVADKLLQGALAVLNRSGVTHEMMDVPGAFEIPVAINYAVKALDFDPARRRFDGYVTLGCIIKGETKHDEIVGHQSAWGLQEISLKYALAIGYGILTCNTHEQALRRAEPEGFDRGGAAAEACLRMIEIKHLYNLSPKRRWVAR